MHYSIRYFRLRQDESYLDFLDMMLEKDWQSVADRILEWFAVKELDQ
ncbi:MAG: hypothetical protein JRI93_15240 [Deltaproteobacteria bacterium]|nr:hypothetical protein [Deltaproteobacteria bacterium]